MSEHVRRVVSLDEVLAMTRELSNWGRWGPDDEIGTLNFITPEKVVAAARSVRQGRVISLSIPFDSSGPQRGGGLGRFNPLHFMTRDGGDAVTGATLDRFGGKDMQIRGADDVVIMPLQCGTQWDGLGHIGHAGHFYNGVPFAAVSSSGAKRLGIQNWRDRIVTRGVLLDIARWKGRDWLEPGEPIYIADLDGCAAAQGVAVERGDIVLIRTGQIAQCRARGSWGEYDGGDAPGLAFECVRWLHDTEIAGFATDTWGTEVRPNETPDVFQPIHVVAIPYVGLLIGEIFDLEELGASCAADGQYDFLFTAPPLPITGAVGSPINPQAVK